METCRTWRFLVVWKTARLVNLSKVPSATLAISLRNESWNALRWPSTRELESNTWFAVDSWLNSSMSSFVEKPFQTSARRRGKPRQIQPITAGNIINRRAAIGCRSCKSIQRKCEKKNIFSVFQITFFVLAKICLKKKNFSMRKRKMLRGYRWGFIVERAFPNERLIGSTFSVVRDVNYVKNIIRVKDMKSIPFYTMTVIVKSINKLILQKIVSWDFFLSKCICWYFRGHIQFFKMFLRFRNFFLVKRN